MAKNKRGNLIEADFTEELVGFSIDSFLSLVSFPNFRVTIEPFSTGRERWLGADARIVDNIKGFKPFYMQFKKPEAYPDYSSSSIIKTRKKFSLETSPNTLFFPLRKKDKDHTDFQHNILYRLRRRLRKYANSDAVYVCPLFLKRSAYRWHLHNSGIHLQMVGGNPWDFGNVLIVDSIGHNFSFSDVPLLEDHVCIPPHDLVTTANHKYSFSDNGKDLCFHSPLSLPEGAYTLSDWVEMLSGNILNEEGLIRVQYAKELLQSLLTDDNNDDPLPYPRELFNNEDDDYAMKIWSKWGEFLRETYSIEQYAFVVWNNESEEKKF